MAAYQDLKAPASKRATGRLVSIQISNGGVPKVPVSETAEITVRGVVGDRQRDLRFHGGPDRAVCLFSMELIERLRSEGHPIGPGTTGENLTISGLEWSLVRTGVRLTIGAVVLGIMAPAHPCKNIAGSFSDGDISRLSAKIHPSGGRMYARVLSPGVVRVGDLVELTATVEDP